MMSVGFEATNMDQQIKEYSLEDCMDAIIVNKESPVLNWVHKYQEI